ncbi:hypothetical protein GCM10027193_16490 [Arenimonas aestuarii]
MADLATDPGAASEVLATIEAMRGTLARAEATAKQLLTEVDAPT